jgi:chorismate synthase
MELNEKKIKNASLLKYVNVIGTSNPCIVQVVVDGVEYGVPMNDENVDYELIKQLLDDGEITIEDGEIIEID